MSSSKHASVTPPLKTGYWASESRPANIAIFTEASRTFFNINWLEHPDICPATEDKVEFGDFGPARKEVVTASGMENYNMKLNGKHKRVISSDGTEIFHWSDLNRVEKLKWVPKQHLDTILKNRDSFDSPRYSICKKEHQFFNPFTLNIQCTPIYSQSREAGKNLLGVRPTGCREINCLPNFGQGARVCLL